MEARRLGHVLVVVLLAVDVCVGGALQRPEAACQWGACFGGCGSGASQTASRPCALGLGSQPLCCSRAMQAQQRWAAGANTLEDACFNRCVAPRVCDDKSKLCVCPVGSRLVDGGCEPLAGPRRAAAARAPPAADALQRAHVAPAPAASQGWVPFAFGATVLLQAGLAYVLCGPGAGGGRRADGVRSD